MSHSLPAAKHGHVIIEQLPLSQIQPLNLNLHNSLLQAQYFSQNPLSKQSQLNVVQGSFPL